MSFRLLLLYVSIGFLVLLRVYLFHPGELYDGDYINTSLRLLSTPVVGANTQQLSVLISGERVVLTVPRLGEYYYGDLVQVSGTLEKKVLDSERVVYSMYFPKIAPARDDMGLPFKIAGFIRARVEEGFGRYLSADQAGLLMGIVFGISGGLDSDLKKQFQIAGVTHVIAASGMNVTLLAGFMLPIFLRITRRRDGLLLTILCLGFYAIISGLSASILRATIMGSIGLFGLMIGRQKTAVISFFMTGCIMVIIAPSIIYDIGFQLSFLATAGMLILMPLFAMLPRLPIVGLVREDLSATLSAQVATTPLLLYYFHSLGLLSVFVNILVLWTIPPLMIIGSVAALFSLVSMSLGGFVAFFALPFLSYFILIADVFSSVSPVFRLERVPVSLVIGYYLLFGAVLVSLRRRFG